MNESFDPSRPSINEWRRTMSKNRHGNERDLGRMAAEATFSANSRIGVEPLSGGSIGGPRLRVRTIEPTAIIRFEDAEVIFEESFVQAVRERLHRLVEEGH